MSRRCSKGMRLIALAGVSLRLGAWPKFYASILKN
jgi:hypothetical protein